MKWPIGIAVAWTAVLGISVVQAAMPASWWFDAGAVHVEDASLGECPDMSFDRVIARPFHANWVVTLLRRGSGGFYTLQTFRGSNDYRPENVLPDEFDLCWWTWSDSLDLAPGDYKVNTLWKLSVNGGIREVRRTSNLFKVTE